MTDIGVRPEVQQVLSPEPPAPERPPSGTPGPDASPSPFRRRRTRISAIGHLVVVGVALGIWLTSLRGVDLEEMNGYGLISVLPVSFFVAMVVVCVGFTVAVVRRLNPAVLLAYPLALLVILHMTVPIVFPGPRYPYVFKHIAVIRYIDEFGVVDRTVDIYQNWPGMFAAGAIFTRLTGVDAADYANWADPFFALCGALGVYLLARSVAPDRLRAVASVWLYVIISCVAQTYLAPQALAFFLTLICIGIALRWSRAGLLDWSWLLFQAVNRLAVSLSRRLISALPRLTWLRLLPEHRSPPPVADPEIGGGRVPPLPAAAAILLLGGAVVVSHQLSPFFLLMSLLALAMIGRCRTFWLVVALAALAVVWIALSFDYVSQHFSILAFNPFDNVTSSQQSERPLAGTVEYQLVGQAARLMAAGAFCLAFVAWWTAPRQNRDTFVWVLAFAPATVLLVQSYGGEALYRVVMFMGPWLAYLGSRLIVRMAGRRWWFSPMVLGLGSSLASVVFVLNYYGLDQVNYVRPQEIRASAWFETNTSSDSVLNLLSGFWPGPATAQYAGHFNAAGDWGSKLLLEPRFAGLALGATDIPDMLSGIRDTQPGKAYLGVGPSQIAAAEMFGFSPPGSVEPFIDLLLKDPGLRIAHQDGDAYILEVLPAPSVPPEVAGADTDDDQLR